jgi:hypothetical protein
MANTATLTIATNIITAPGEAFAAIKERPSPWFPLLVIAIVAAVASYLFVDRVDLAWFLDTQIRAQGQMTDEERAQAVETIQNIPKAVYVASGIASSLIFYPVFFALAALYFTGVSFATNTGVKFKQWFALTAWCCLPFVLGLFATIANLLANDVRFMLPQTVNPLSFGNLLGIEAANTSGVEGFLLSRDPTTLWVIVLIVFGYQALSQKSLVSSATVVLAPFALIVLLSALVSLF